MEFAKIAAVFESIESESSRLEIMVRVREALDAAKPAEVRQVVYLLQGKLAPDFENIDIGMGEKFVVQSIVRVSGFSAAEVNKRFQKLGDLGLVAHEVLQKRKQQAFFSAHLSVEKVFSNLLKMARVQGTGSQELKIKLLAELLNSATPVEAKYLVRIPMEQLRLGLGDPTIMDALALSLVDEVAQAGGEEIAALEDEIKINSDKKPQQWSDEKNRKIRVLLRTKIEAKYNVHPDLGVLAEKIKEKGLFGIDAIALTPGIPIRPTAAERVPSSVEIIAKLGRCAVEPKYDGFRLQCHKKDDAVTIFSRKSENVTKSFPDVVSAIKKQINAKSAVFEAEAIAFNPKTNEFFPFQVTITRKRKYDISEKSKEFPLKLFCFDVMYLNGRDVMGLPFKERRKLLSEMVAKGDSLELAPQIVTDDASEIDRFFDESVSAGLEGIMAKDLNAPYIAGARKFAWIKLKRSYKGELSDTVDVVIVGYYAGQGKRTQFGLGGLLTAVYNADSESFETIAKIGTGMSEQMLSDLRDTLSKMKTDSKPANVVSNLKPDFWVKPKLVIEVRADEITKSPVHTAGQKEAGSEGFALRFPRLIKLRNDKGPTDTTTVKEILGMYQNQRQSQSGDAPD